MFQALSTHHISTRPCTRSASPASYSYHISFTLSVSVSATPPGSRLVTEHEATDSTPRKLAAFALPAAPTRVLSLFFRIQLFALCVLRVIDTISTRLLGGLLGVGRGVELAEGVIRKLRRSRPSFGRRRRGHSFRVDRRVCLRFGADLRGVFGLGGCLRGVEDVA